MDQEIKRDEGKPRLTLAPLEILYDIAAVREYGLKKYGDSESWQKVKAERYRDAAFPEMVFLISIHAPLWGATGYEWRC